MLMCRVVATRSYSPTTLLCPSGCVTKVEHMHMVWHCKVAALQIRTQGLSRHDPSWRKPRIQYRVKNTVFIFQSSLIVSEHLAGQLVTSSGIETFLARKIGTFHLHYIPACHDENACEFLLTPSFTVPRSSY